MMDKQPRIINIIEIIINCLNKIPPYIKIKPKKMRIKANERILLILFP